MLDIGGGELLVIGIVALVVIGPKELPGLLRTAGNAMSKVRRMAAEFRGQFDEAMREAELDEAKKAFHDADSAARSATTGGFNPLDTIRNEIKAVKDDMKGPQAADAAPAPPAEAALPSTPVDVLPDPMVDLPPPPPPMSIAPAAEATSPEPAAKPKRVRKKAAEKPADETSGTPA